MDTPDELAHLFRTAPVGLALVDRNFRFLHMNDWLAATIGKPVAEQIGRTLEEVFPEIATQVCRGIGKYLDRCLQELTQYPPGRRWRR